MKPTDPLYKLYWDYAEFSKEQEEYERAYDVFSKFLDPDIVGDILCEMKEAVGLDTFRAGFMTATRIFMGGNGE